MNSSVHIDNRRKDILILGDGPTQGLDDTTLTAEATQSNRKLCLSLHYIGSNSFLFVNATKTYQFKEKGSEIKTWYKIMFALIKKIFMGLFINVVNASTHTKCVSLSNQKCEIQPTFINLYPNEYIQEL